jgi:hypothetical protein
MTETTEKPIEKPLPHVHEDVHDPQAKQLISRPYEESDRKPSAMPGILAKNFENETKIQKTGDDSKNYSCFKPKSCLSEYYVPLLIWLHCIVRLMRSN